MKQQHPLETSSPSSEKKKKKWGPQEIQEWFHVLSYARRDPRIGFWPKFWAALAVGYMLSPIDLIPDFIPLLGQLDDLVILPLLFALAIRSIPPEVIRDARSRWAQEQEQEKGPPFATGKS
ncbi:MAG TPA: YkvA family protein [Termitinemataceae bacterium]|nr:YkvA family protein [Termitinemataceae bacterium]